MIYLDYNATTPVDPRVLKEMLPYFSEHFGNSLSQHSWGWTAQAAVQKSRQQIARLVGARESEIVFTSGATESNNWVIFGLIHQWRKENPEQKIHIISTVAEHNSILKALEAASVIENVSVDLLPVNNYGQVSIEMLEKAIRPETRLISIIWANNELGTVNSINELSQIAKKKSIYFHTDATQTIGKIPVNLLDVEVDLMSFSSHKMYGPKGVGALYIRSRQPYVQMQPLHFGGGHERGLRSGTLDTPGIVGFGKACEIIYENFQDEMNHLQELKDAMIGQLRVHFPNIQINGHPVLATPNTINVTFKGYKIALYQDRLMSLGFSAGSACGSKNEYSSHVLKAIGLTPEETQSTIRFSLGRMTTLPQITEAVLKCAEVFKG